MEREINSRLKNHLVEGHVAPRGEVRSLISSSPASRVSQPKLERNETQLLVRETGDLVLEDIL